MILSTSKSFDLLALNKTEHRNDMNRGRNQVPVFSHMIYAHSCLNIAILFLSLLVPFLSVLNLSEASGPRQGLLLNYLSLN